MTKIIESSYIEIMRKKILLIEDDSAIIDVYKTGLESTGKFKVEVITLGNEALEKIKRINEEKDKKPDLVLLDIILPDINGLEILRKIRQGEKTKDLLVFVLTNYGSKEFEREGFKLKVKKYITKTECPPSKLVKLIEEELNI